MIGSARVNFGWSSKKASHYLWLWSKRDLVQPLGGKSDVFCNRVSQPAPDWPRAAVMAMPSSVLIGMQPLLEAGWITQIPQKPEIAVDESHPIFAITPFLVQPLPPGWFELTRPAVRAFSRGRAMPALPPAWALADMLARQGWEGCSLDPDDLYWDEIGPQEMQSLAEGEWQAMPHEVQEALREAMRR